MRRGERGLNSPPQSPWLRCSSLYDCSLRDRRAEKKKGQEDRSSAARGRERFAREEERSFPFFPLRARIPHPEIPPFCTPLERLPKRL